MKFLLSLLLTFEFLFSAPAFSIVREFQQSDGTVFTAKAQGDEFLNWVETKDGDILKYSEKNKNFEYAKIEDSKLKGSGIKYNKKDFRGGSSLKYKVNKTELYKLWGEKRKEANLKKINYF